MYDALAMTRRSMLSHRGFRRYKCHLYNERFKAGHRTYFSMASEWLKCTPWAWRAAYECRSLLDDIIRLSCNELLWCCSLGPLRALIAPEGNISRLIIDFRSIKPSGSD